MCDLSLSMTISIIYYFTLLFVYSIASGIMPSAYVHHSLFLCLRKLMYVKEDTFLIFLLLLIRV